MRRARNCLWYFTVVLAIVAFLQLGFFLFTQLSPSTFTSSTSNSYQFFRQLGSEQELENATQTTTVPQHLYTESTWNFEHKTTLITNRTCVQYYFLLILVSSAPANLHRRDHIRKTWAFESAFKPRWTTFFLVAQTPLQTESNSLLKEDEVYGDLVRADYFDHYWNQTLKIQMGFEWATRYCKFSFLLKVDDDVFVNSAGLLSFLSKPTTPKENLYTGERRINPPADRARKWKVTIDEYKEKRYPDFCPGFGFVLSHDVVVKFLKAFSIVPFFRLDDVYVGMLANKTGIKIIHNAGFELNAPNRCIPHEGTLVRHETLGDCLIEIFNRAAKLVKYTGV
ncbi:hypothetical protein OS493_007676 [Desmophyllum pertusum]|uniref:Hexosyltransferase n=1 Tax=Desmophyllum pertusum TaxID=174260 RepID=A0A9W9YRT2_9CNID|nr:hypothetical protein OS493_007676 [Desmophyllum pertusum]